MYKYRNIIGFAKPEDTEGLRTVHAEALKIRMDLDAGKTQITKMLKIFQKRLRTREKGSEAGKSAVGFLYGIGYEFVDALDLVWRRGNGVHDVMGDSRSAARADQTPDCSVVNLAYGKAVVKPVDG
jgi:hypothetical protein